MESRKETLPWSWSYLSVCLLMPSLNGLICGYMWSGLTLHYRDMGWPISSSGMACSVGFLFRAVAQQIQLWLGFWGIVPQGTLHLLAAIFGAIYFTEEWAVLGEVVALTALNSSLTIEGMAFEVFGRSVSLASQATSTVLAVFTVAVAVGVAVGGTLYDLTGWQGMAAFHAAVQGFLLLLLASAPVTRRSFVKFFFAHQAVHPDVPADLPVIHKSPKSGASIHAEGRPHVASPTCRTDDARSVALPGACDEPREAESTAAMSRWLHMDLATDMHTSTVKPTIDKCAVEEEPKVKRSGIPKDVRLPAALLVLTSFNNQCCYHMEFITFAIFFREYHGWDSAVWASLCQMAGDLVAAVAMKLVVMQGSDKAGCSRRTMWQPYNLAWLLFFWTCCNLGMTSPLLAAAVTAQVLMGTVFVYAQKAVTDLNLFYSLGDSGVFLTLQAQCQNAVAIGGCISSTAALLLYDYISPFAPFVLAACISTSTLLLFLAGFCHRVGFGHDLEAAEARRSQRLGIQRVSAWSGKTSPCEEVTGVVECG